MDNKIVRICQREALRNERLHRIGFLSRRQNIKPKSLFPTNMLFRQYHSWSGLAERIPTQMDCRNSCIQLHKSNQCFNGSSQPVFRFILAWKVHQGFRMTQTALCVFTLHSIWDKIIAMSILKSDKVIAEKLRRFSRIRLAETWEQQWTKILYSCNNPNRHNQTEFGQNRSIRKWRELLRMNISLRRECWSISSILASLRITAYSQLYVNICHYVIGVYARTCLPWIAQYLSYVL